jgi:hypothetical protein
VAWAFFDWELHKLLFLIVLPIIYKDLLRLTEYFRWIL